MSGMTPSQLGLMFGLWLLVVIVFYLVVMLPQRKRLKQHREFLASLRAGDKVITVGGIYGTIVALSTETVQLEVGGGAVLTLAKAALRRRQPAPGELTT